MRWTSIPGPNNQQLEKSKLWILVCARVTVNAHQALRTVFHFSANTNCAISQGSHTHLLQQQTVRGQHIYLFQSHSGSLQYDLADKCSRVTMDSANICNKFNLNIDRLFSFYILISVYRFLGWPFNSNCLGLTIRGLQT